MENKFVKMESKANTRNGFLLPRYFFKIGLVLMITGLAGTLMINFIMFESDLIWSELIKVLVRTSFVLGLFFTAWSKDKIEDEMTLSIRLKAIAWSVAWVVAYVTIRPFVSFLFSSEIEKVGGFEVVVSMLLVYLMVYYFSKRNS